MVKFNMEKYCKSCNGRINKWNKKYCSRLCFYKDMIGHKVSEKVKEIFSKYSKTKTPWNKNKKNLQQSGKNHWNWRGGVSKIHKNERQLAMNSFEYKQWRKAVFERDYYRCVLCGDKKGGNLEADHIKSWEKYKKLRFVVDNGRTLCHKCHILTETYGNKKGKKHVI